MVNQSEGPAYEADYTPTITGSVSTYFLPGTSIEIVREPQNRGECRHVLFDFDGTLSLIREGWPEVMVPMMVGILLETPRHESAEELRTLAHEFVMRLNGKQTIYQMIQLSEEVKKRGGTPRDPLEYKEMYHQRLMERIASRRETLRSGKAGPADFLVPGSVEILASFREREIPLYLASGTDEKYVREEADLLRITEFFDRHLYGAVDDYQNYSKQMVIDRILRENRIPGERLLGFGDGYVEIQNVKSAGGTAVAVASDEAGRSGKPDAWKRDRLIGVGADLVIPDFRDHGPLLAYLFPDT
jgi:phosphoglycolate phosphatase-like HAD superfamily hydrolase